MKEPVSEASEVIEAEYEDILGRVSRVVGEYTEVFEMGSENSYPVDGLSSDERSVLENISDLPGVDLTEALRMHMSKEESVNEFYGFVRFNMNEEDVYGELGVSPAGSKYVAEIETYRKDNPQDIVQQELNEKDENLLDDIIDSLGETSGIVEAQTAHDYF